MGNRFFRIEIPRYEAARAMNLQRYVLSYQQNRQAIHVRRYAHRSKGHVRDYVILGITLKGAQVCLYVTIAISRLLPTHKKEKEREKQKERKRDVT